MPSDNTGRDWGDRAASQGTPGTVQPPPGAGTREGTSPYRLPRAHGPAETLVFFLLRECDFGLQYCDTKKAL